MKSVLLLLLVPAFVATAAEPKKEKPFTPGGLYRRGDMQRPRPTPITPPTETTPSAPGQAPSDAIVLFDGKDLSKFKRLPPKGAADASDVPQWKIENGYAEIAPKAGTIETREKFGSSQIHLEWAAPAEVKGSSQSRGNSGVLLSGWGEVQVLDSFENDTYPDGQAAAIYSNYPPLVNASRRPGEWQSFDIICECATLDEQGKVLQPARLTVIYNGVIVHHAVERPFTGQEFGFALQDHHSPVRYRNIWVRPLHRYDENRSPLAPLAATADWPGFRGPWGDGQVSAPGETRLTGLPLTWSETENIVWKTAIPERGWSTPAVMAGQIWLTTATLEGNDFSVLSVDAATGQIRLNNKLFHCAAPEPLGNKVNCYATPSPALEPGRVYLHFGSYGTACLDSTTGETLWQRQDLPCRHYRGPSSSPVLFENLIILTMDGADLQYLVALDKQTGRTVWQTNRSVEWNDAGSTIKMVQEGDRRKAHSTPLLVTIDGQPRLLSTGAKAAYAYDPRTGRELWRVRYEAWSAAPVPVYRQGLMFLVTGLGKTELLAVRTDGRGDVTDTHIAWRFDSMVAKTASPVLVDDLLYMVTDDGIVTCLESANGKQVWRERLSGKYAASPIHADGRLYFCNQEGKTTVVKPGRTWEILATNTLETGLMASPSVAGKALFLRTKTHLYRLAIAPSTPAS